MSSFFRKKDILSMNGTDTTHLAHDSDSNFNFRDPRIGRKLEIQGYLQADDSGGNPASLQNSLSLIESAFISQEGNVINSENVAAKVRHDLAILKSEVKAHKTRIKEIKNDSIKHLQNKIESCQKLIKKHEKEEIEILGSYDPLKGTFLIITLILLSLFLWFFYVSAGYSAFFSGLAEKLMLGSLDDAGTMAILFSGIFNPNVLFEAGNALFILSLFPIVFWSFGMAFHSLLTSSSRFMKWILIPLIFIANFALDAFVAYKIEEQINRIKYMIDIPVEPWYASPNVYIVLLLGLGSYIIWSILLHFFFLEFEKKKPAIQIQKAIKASNQKIEVFEKKKGLARKKIATEKEGIRSKKAKIEQLLDQQNNKTVSYDQLKLIQYLRQFYNGWLSGAGEHSTNPDLIKQYALILASFTSKSL